MSGWWWLSYTKGFGNLGVCIVQGKDVLSAAKKAHQLGIAPPGLVEVFGIPIPEKYLPLYEAADRCRLLTPAESRKLATKDQPPLNYRKDTPL